MFDEDPYGAERIAEAPDQDQKKVNRPLMDG
jgi:hypothetical protein